MIQMELVIYGAASLTSNPDKFLGWNVTRLSMSTYKGTWRTLGDATGPVKNNSAKLTI